MNWTLKIGNNATIELLNHKRIWRTNVANTTTILPPSGYSTSWTIYESESLDSITTGSTSTVSYTFLHEHQFANYDLEIVVTKGLQSYTRYLRRIITVIPQRPTVYDEVFDLTNTAIGSGGKTWSNIDRAGYTLKYTGSYNDRVQLNRLYTDTIDPVTGRLDYIHVVFDANATITATVSGRAYALQCIGNCRGIFFDCYADDEGNSGTTFASDSGAGSGQTVYVSGTGNKEIIFGGLNIVGVSNSAAGLSVQTTATAGQNYDNFNFSGLQIMDCTITNAGDEGIYLNYFTDSLQSGYRYCQMNGARVFRNRIINAGWDGIQWGICKNIEVHNNYVKNSGTKDTGGQNYGMIANHGSSGVVYQNKLVSVRPALFQHIGQTGEGMIWTSNVIESQGAEYWLITTVQEHVETSKVHSVQVYRNTIISTGRMWVDNSSATTTDVGTIKVQNNIIVGNYNSGNFLIEDFGASETLTGNNFTATASIGDLNFVNVSQDNYKLTTTSPSDLNNGDVLTGLNRWVNYDYEGILYDDLTTKGAYSGYELNTL